MTEGEVTATSNLKQEAQLWREQNTRPDPGILKTES
jgi:hypothetical protein